MKIFSSYGDGALRICIRGELDHHEAGAAMQKLSALIDDYLPRDCAVDLSGLTFMDSSGIALILRVMKLVKETGGRVWVENPQKQPARVIDASGIDRVIDVRHAAREAAR